MSAITVFVMKRFNLILWEQTLLRVWRSVVVAVLSSVGVGRVPETWQFVGWQEGTRVPVHGALFRVTIPTALGLTGGRVWQWYLSLKGNEEEEGKKKKQLSDHLVVL